MKFKVTFCDPFQKDIIEMGLMPENKIVETFNGVPWTSHLKRMENKPDEQIFYSPSFEVENEENKNGLSISAVGPSEKFEFYIFYKRPKFVSRFFGLVKGMNNNYMTEIHGQTKEDAVACLYALLKNDFSFLENKIK